MRSSVLQRWVYAWACLAMLLVLVAPLISRALLHATPAATHLSQVHAGHHQARQSVAAEPRHVHHRMAHGRDHAQTPSHDSAAAAPSATPVAGGADSHAGHDMAVDCDYCVIAARMISLLVALVLLMTVGPVHFRALAGPVSARQSPSPGTLGARGPPHALAC
jgi:hypothetical protein